MSPALLEIDRLCKSFPGVQALNEVSLRVEAGEVHALVGENGAGKSTLMKVLSGIYAPDSGTIRLAGQRIDPSCPADALHLGISSVHQEISLAPNLTGAENILAGREPTRLGLVRWRRLQRQAEDLLRLFGVPLRAGARVGSLSPAMRQIVEIARAVSHHPKLLMLDEPTSSLEVHEVSRLVELLRRLAAQGLGIVYVTHKLKEVFEVADRVTVLRDGRFMATKSVPATTADEVVRLMVGRELGQLYPPKSDAIGCELLRVQGFSLARRFQNVSFTLHSGEILGMAGLVGAGRSELAQTLFGYYQADEGKAWLRGKEIAVRSPAEAVRCGLAYLPEDRKTAGLFPAMSLEENLFSVGLGKYTRHGLVCRKRLRSAAQAWVERLAIRTPSLGQTARWLSGGNQQKTLIARWLDMQPAVLIADEPTRGVDIGAKTEIHALLRRLCSEGVGIIVISSELPEILGLCDRVLVLHEGTVAGELDAGEATEESVMRLATGQASGQVEACAA